jgi:hypothetical protein
MLRYGVWWILTDVSEEFTASVIRMMSKPRAEKWGWVYEWVGQGIALAGPMGERVRQQGSREERERDT